MPATVSLLPVQAATTAEVAAAPTPSFLRKSLRCIVLVDGELNGFVDFVAFDVDGGEWAGGAEVLACAATDAACFVDGRDLRSIFGGTFERHHRNCAHRAMAFAVAAVNAIPNGNAVLLNPYGVTDLRARFLLEADGLDGTGGAHLRATVALRSTISQFITHGGLHHSEQVGRWAQHIVGTFAHTELATGATASHVLSGGRAWGCDGRCAVGCHFVLNGSQTAVNFHFLLSKSRCGDCHCRRGDNCPSALIRRFATVGIVLLFSCGGFCGTAQRVVQSVEVALAETVSANHAARVIDFHIFEVDARSLAVAGTFAALAAFVGIEAHFKKREAGEKSEDCADGADGVAISATAVEGEGENYHENGDCDYERGQRAHPNVDGVEGVTFVMFGNGGEQVVAGFVGGFENVGHDDAKTAVRLKQSHERARAEEESGDKHEEEAVAQPFPFGREGVAVLFSAKTRHNVLHDAQRTNHRAIDAAENERQDDKDGYNGEIQGKQGRQELDFGGPAEPEVQDTRNVEEKERDSHEQQYGEGNSDFS